MNYDLDDDIQRAEEIISCLEREILPLYRWAYANTDLQDDTLSECPKSVFYHTHTLYRLINELVDITSRWD